MLFLWVKGHQHLETARTEADAKCVDTLVGFAWALRVLEVCIINAYKPLRVCSTTLQKGYGKCISKLNRGY